MCQESRKRRFAHVYVRPTSGVATVSVIICTAFCRLSSVGALTSTRPRRLSTTYAPHPSMPSHVHMAKSFLSPSDAPLMSLAPLQINGNETHS